MPDGYDVSTAELTAAGDAVMAVGTALSASALRRALACEGGTAVGDAMAVMRECDEEWELAVKAIGAELSVAGDTLVESSNDYDDTEGVVHGRFQLY